MIRSEFTEDREYEIIVIGGGITGAAVAYDAASRGLSVALVEKDDFGSKTSSATSKLIHGGLRYLANLELSLVRESLKERKILEKIAPNFVYPSLNMIIFNNPEMISKKIELQIGMILYDILSFDKKFIRDKSKRLPNHKCFSGKKTVEAEPLLDSPGLNSSIVYYDCASLFPERLTLAFLKSAAEKGADIANYIEVTGFINHNRKIEGVTIHDKIKNRKTEIRGKLTINCAGPWADRVLSMAGSTAHMEILRRSEGIHIITKKLTDKFIVTSSTPGGRHIFIIPWRGYSLIGTTDKEYIGSPDDWKIRKESILDFIDDINASYGQKIKLTYDDVIYCYGGLRPLVEDQTESVYESSRKYEIFDNAEDGFEGLITVEGGKYTTSRGLAENVMRTICRKNGIPFKKAGTDREYLFGCEIEDIEAFIKFCKSRYSAFPEDTIDYLSRIYGTEIDAMIQAAGKNKSLLKPFTGNGEIAAQIVYAVENEMAFTLPDILMRRTGIGTLGNPGRKILQQTADIAGKILGWSEARKKKEIKEAENIFAKP